MDNVMVDLETVGRRAGCGILSVGAVAFDPDTGELGPEFYQVVRLNSCINAGLHIDKETMDWWASQSIEARKVFAQARSSKSMPLKKSLIEFNGYLTQFPSGVKIWGNGADFDNAILISCYSAVGIIPSWDFWNNRCFRTLKNLVPDIKIDRVGTYHNALDDAKTQALHAIKVFSYLYGIRR